MTLQQTSRLTTGNNIHFMAAFKYLGSIITPCLTEDKEIDARIKKAKSQMGLLRHFFNCKDVNLSIKYWIYMAGPLNILLWGSESWNLSEQNQDKLNAFHHTAIRQILGIWMDEVIECHIMNEQVQKWFCNIPKVNSFITRRTWKYMGKVYRARGESLPKKMLGAWVPATRKAGRPQMSCKDNFICTLKEVLNNQISDEATFKEWFPIAADEAKWNSLIEDHFQKLCADDLRADDRQNYEYKPFIRFDVSQE